MPQPPSPSAAVGQALRCLRRRYLVRRVLATAALAMALDLLHKVAARFGVALYIPFFATVVVVVLLWRERRRWTLGAFGAAVDRRFGLKDRLYSFLAFQSDPQISPALREAQAAECAAAVAFGDLGRRLGRRQAWALALVAPLWLAAVALELVSVYQGPQHAPPSAGRRGPAKPEGPPPRAPASAPAGRTPRPPTEESATKSSPVAHPPDRTPKDRAEDSPATKEALRRRLDRTGPKEPLKSTYAKKEVAAPTAPALERTSSFEGGSMKDPQRFLSLLPKVRDPAGAVEGDELDALAFDAARYPVKYRKQIVAYYAKLRELTGEKRGAEAGTRSNPR